VHQDRNARLSTRVASRASWASAPMKCPPMKARRIAPRMARMAQVAREDARIMGRFLSLAVLAKGGGREELPTCNFQLATVRCSATCVRARERREARHAVVGASGRERRDTCDGAQSGPYSQAYRIRYKQNESLTRPCLGRATQARERTCLTEQRGTGTGEYWLAERGRVSPDCYFSFWRWGRGRSGAEPSSASGSRTFDLARSRDCPQG
jgi:hypothetical protein